MSVTGKWINSYGSVMNLEEASDGSIVGQYSSTTGSTGVYWVVGFADTGTSPTGSGQALALTIFWRSITAGNPDPSWHWVSGMSGQQIPQDGTPNLILMHAMVATDDYPTVAPVGTYLDKLIFTPDRGTSPVPARPKPTVADIPDPIQGAWTCLQDASITLAIEVMDAEAGFVSGILKLAGGAYVVLGFADTYAQSGGLALEGLTVAANVGGGSCLCLSGSLDLADGTLSLLQMKSTGTTAAVLYAQTAAQGLYFRKA